MQAGSEVSALLGRMPSQVGYQPTLETRWAASGADHLDSPGLGHLDSGDLRPGRRPHRPGAGVGVRAPERDDDAVALDRGEGHLPGRRSARLDVDDLKADIVGEEHFQVANDVREILQRYKELQDIIAILGIDEFSDEDKLIRAAGAQDRAVPVAAVFRGRGVHWTPGVYVSVEDTVRSSRRSSTASTTTFPSGPSS